MTNDAVLSTVTEKGALAMGTFESNLAVAIREGEQEVEAKERELRLLREKLNRVKGFPLPTPPAMRVREAIKHVITNAGRPLTSREINTYIREVPLNTRSKNLPSMIQATLVLLVQAKEVAKKGRKGHSVYSVIEG